jgi:allophanate hydrolase
VPPDGVAGLMRVVGIPGDLPGLAGTHERAWKAAVDRLRVTVPHVVTVDVTPLLAAGELLYGGAFLASRWEAFGHHLTAADGIDPAVRQVVHGGSSITGADVFRDQHRLAELRRASEPLWHGVDAIMLPVTPDHPSLAQVAADPVGVNTRLGTYTSFANLLDLCAVAVPADARDDGLPFGVQFLAPAFADDPLLRLSQLWCGEAVGAAAAPPGTTLLAVVGAHLSRLPLNAQLVGGGGRLAFRARTGPGYRLYRLPGGPVARPGLVRTGDGPAHGIEVEVWRVPYQTLGALQDSIPAPLALGRVQLDDGGLVVGFIAEHYATASATDITEYGGWRAALRARP